MNKREANVLDTEAKDGKLIRDTGAAAVKVFFPLLYILQYHNT